MAVEVQRRPPLSNGALGSGHQVSSIKRPPRKPKECISVNGQSRTHFLSNDPSESSTGDESAHNSEEALANRSGDSAISGKRKRTAPAPTEAQLPDHLEEPVAKRFRSGSTEHFTSAEDESSDLSPAQPSRKYRCEFEGCGRVFKKSSKLRRHERTHFNERPFACPFPRCTKAYLRNEHLVRHARTHAPVEEDQKPFRCEDPACGRGFATKYHLNRHAKTHDTPKPYKCTFENCSEAFAKHGQLRNHFCIHTGEKPYPCTSPGCEKSFTTAQKLKQHMRTHNSESRYLCGHADCEAAFPKWSLLQSHIKDMHKIVCTICKRSFSRRDTLKEHMKTHAEEREMFACEWDDCGKTFTSEKIRTIHYRTVHEQLKPFACDHPDCDATFGHKHLLVRHRRTHDAPKQRKKRKDAIPPCTDVLELLTGYNYDGEVTGRTIKCSVEGCRYAFRREYDLKRHLKSMHDQAGGDNENGEVPHSMEEEQTEAEVVDRRSTLRERTASVDYVEEVNRWSDTEDEYRVNVDEEDSEEDNAQEYLWRC